MDNLPATLGDLEKMAAVMSRSQIFNKTPEQLLSLMLIAQAEGIHPAIAAQEYDIIQGRPAITSRSALARFQAAGGSIKWIKRDDLEAKLWLHHPQGGELIVSWTIERAKKAGLAAKDNWLKYPAQMLAARAVAEGVRAVYPACLNRMYTSEEAGDMEMINVTPPPGEPPSAPAPEPEPDPIPLELGDLRAKLAEYLKDPLLPKSGRDIVTEALAREDCPASELADLVERSRDAIERVRAAKK